MNRFPHAGLICMASLMFAATSAVAEIYRWTDAKGGQHFSMDLNDVPPQYRAAAEASAGTVGRRANINLIQPSTKSSSSRLRSPASPNPGAKRKALEASGEEGDEVGGYPEPWWRAQAEEYARSIEALEKRVEACADLDRPRRYNRRTGRGLKRQHYDRKMAALERCSSDESTLEIKQRQRSSFVERARKSGVPPGWVRVR